MLTVSAETEKTVDRYDGSLIITGAVIVSESFHCDNVHSL